ncbi:MAG: DUF6498-containing protein [Gammaproteobacteria bacterium]|nr:DUF6498-containing protein [Gammaproteobacteria bacterium]MDH4314897.1 DUF6498-containing protein [Gammaproteobacteria bacterium]MDH5501152.1 DUF6498-containing protein [Gammaproteobacteria bacterium]
MSTVAKPASTDASLPLAGQLGLSALSLITANSLLLVLFFVYDVTLFQLVLVYWCECVWIGIFSAFKLITASTIGDPYRNRFAEVSGGTGVFLSLFVIGFSSTAFFSLLGMILMGILMANEALALSNPGDAMFNHIGLVLGASLLLMASHAISFVGNFLLLGEFKTARIGTLLALPFKRCLALLVTIALSIAFVAMVPALASTTAFAVVVIVLKTLWDAWLHKSERRGY